MYAQRILVLLFCWLFCTQVFGQTPDSIAIPEPPSQTLYNAGQWKELLKYGKKISFSEDDLALLHMRVGYAAFMLGNFSQSLTHYEKALTLDTTNNTALGYVYLNNLYLNNIPATRFYQAKLPKAEASSDQKVPLVKLATIAAEFSYKVPSDTTRKHARYLRAGFSVYLGPYVELQQSVALYNQEINEAALTSVTQNRHININQKEYYGKILVAVAGDLTVMGGFHYLYTPFNNYIYHNTVAFGGLKYTTPFAHFEASANFATLTDLAYTQYNGGLTLFPFGNPKVYSITRFAYSTASALTQVIGVGVTKNIWLETNTVIGNYRYLLDNDALYVYNDIDQKKFKLGASVYANLTKNLAFSFNFTSDQKTRYNTENKNFTQYALTQGLTWKF